MIPHDNKRSMTRHPTKAEEALKAKALSLLGQFHAAVNARDFAAAKHIASQLVSCGVAVGVSTSELEEVIKDAKQAEKTFLDNIMELAQNIVTTAVSVLMSVPSKLFFGQLDSPHLRDAFANIEAARMDDTQLAQLQKSLSEHGTFSDPQRFGKLSDALATMEKYKIDELQKQGGSKEDLDQVSEVFQRARQHTQSLLSHMKHAPKDAKPEMTKALLKANKEALQTDLNEVHAVLVPGDTPLLAVSDVSSTHGRVEHGLPLVADGKTVTGLNV
jgi:hypothetical protein